MCVCVCVCFWHGNHFNAALILKSDTIPSDTIGRRGYTSPSNFSQISLALSPSLPPSSFSLLFVSLMFLSLSLLRSTATSPDDRSSNSTQSDEETDLDREGLICFRILTRPI